MSRNPADRIVNTTLRMIDVAPLAYDAIRNIRDSQPGYPGGGSGGRGSNTCTQPERMAGLAGDVDKPVRGELSADQAVCDLIEIEEAAIRHEKTGEALARLINAWGVRRQPIRNLPDDPRQMWCRSCLRVNWHSARRSKGGELCRWCLEHIPEGKGPDGKAWTMPPIGAVEAYSKGIPVTAALMDRCIVADRLARAKDRKKGNGAKPETVRRRHRLMGDSSIGRQTPG